MKKEIVINATNEESRIAVIEDGKLAEIFVQSPHSERLVGDIYKGKVRKVLPGMQAAFIDIGFHQDGFLHFSDVGNTFLATGEDDIEDEVIQKAGNTKDRAIEIAKSLKSGQEILVQIVKEPISNKGPRVTTDISLAGRYVVLMPNQKNVGISRKIYSASEKRRLRKIARSQLPKGWGSIIRTAAVDQPETALANDYKYLIKQWKKIESEAKKVAVKTRLHKDMDMVDAIIRDHFKDDVSLVTIDSRKVWRETKAYLKEFSPELLKKLAYYGEKNPIFDQFGIEAELQKSLEKKVWLKSGGYLIIEQTEALTSIDVNSGRFMGKEDHETNSMKINLDAGLEIARQLRLRDIGGIIIVDYIDVDSAPNKKKVFTHLTSSMKRDRAISKVSELSRFGLIEMTRQRIRPPVIHKFYETCPTCLGNGMVPTVNNTVAQIERWIRRYRAGGGDIRLVLSVHSDVEDYLLKGFFNKKYELMIKYFVVLKVVVDEHLHKHQFKVSLKKSGDDITNQIKA